MRNTKGNRVQAEGPLVRPQAHTFSLMGNGAPTTAREWDLPTHGALTLFFRWRKKSVQKKASGTATPEAAHVAMRRGLRSAGALWAVLDLGSLRLPAGKKASTAHFDGGARNVARDLVGQITPTLVRAPVLAFFRRQNGRAFFPSLPNAALLPRSWHRADSNSGAWELQRSLAASQRRETDLIFSFTVGARHA